MVGSLSFQMFPSGLRASSAFVLVSSKCSSKSDYSVCDEIHSTLTDDTGLPPKSFT